MVATAVGWLQPWEWQSCLWASNFLSIYSSKEETNVLVNSWKEQMLSVRALVKTAKNIPDPQKQPIILVLQEPCWVYNNPPSQAPLLLWARTHFPRQGRDVDCAGDKDFYSVQHLSPWEREPGTFDSFTERPTHRAWGCRCGNTSWRLKAATSAGRRERYGHSPFHGQTGGQSLGTVETSLTNLNSP